MEFLFVQGPERVGESAVWVLTVMSCCTKKGQNPNGGPFGLRSLSLSSLSLTKKLISFFEKKKTELLFSSEEERA